MAGKHFVHDPVQLVQTSLASVPQLNPSVGYHAQDKIVYQRQRQHRHQLQPTSGILSHTKGGAGSHAVSIISGGGSGHEPSFASYVGEGLLTAAVAGSIFASPSAEQIRRALERVNTTRGVLVLVMNYTGDVLNFGLAVEQARASGIKVEMVIVGDDVSVGREQGGRVGRRGIAGTVLVQKITGALAATGASLEEVYQVAQLVSTNLVSIGASLGHVHVPGSALPPSTFLKSEPGSEEVEIGMGIHNESGSQRVRSNLPELVKMLLAQLLDRNDKDRRFLRIDSQDDIVVMVNNLGGLSQLEMGSIVTEVLGQLKLDHHIRPVRVLSGTYMTSLNGSGFSITLLKIVDADLGPGKSMLDLLAAPAQALGWSSVLSPDVWTKQWNDVKHPAIRAHVDRKSSKLKIERIQAERMLRAGLQALIEAEPDITRYDVEVGDGDCGISLKRGAEAILQEISNGLLLDDAVLVLERIAQVVERTMDGTSGALYSIFLNSLVHLLATLTVSSSGLETRMWAQALKMSLDSLGKYTPAKVGDRTVIDALQPFVEVLQQDQDLKQAAAAAMKGAESTKGMRPRLGRAVYIGGSAWEDVPDPGAYGLSMFLNGLAEALNSGQISAP